MYTYSSMLYHHFYLFSKKTTFLTSCLLLWPTKPFQNGSTCKGKNLLLQELKVNGGINENGRVASLESVFSQLKCILCFLICLLFIGDNAI